MSTFDTAGKHSLGCWRALAADVRGVSPLVSEAFTRECDWYEANVQPEDFFGLCLSHFPKIGKWHDKMISSLGDCPDVPTSELLPVDWIPVIGSLYGGQFSAHVKFSGSLDPSIVAMARQALLMFKKSVVPWRKDADKLAAEEFWKIDQELRCPRSIDRGLAFHVVGGSFADGLSEHHDARTRRLVRMMDKLSGWLIPGRELNVLDLIPGHGPGAVSDSLAGEDKYLFNGYASIIDEVMPSTYFCAANETLGTCANVVAVKPAAKLVAVPKTFDKPRLIASEPVVHQYLQQGLMKWLRANMHSHHKATVNFRDQMPSQEAALEASLNNSSVTIDLSAASDRLSVWVVESFLCKHPMLLDLLLRTRSSRVYDPIFKRGEGELRKFAPMGSAVTFPVQSLVYATAAYAAVIVATGLDKRSDQAIMRSMRRIAKQVRVFGDDLIIPGSAYPEMSLILQFLQLKVNPDKTHTNGFFRESCGMDAYKGHDVTPAYISYAAPERPGTLFAAYVEQSNNAHRKGLWHLANWMKEQTPRSMRRLTPISKEELAVVSFWTCSTGTIAARARFYKPLWRWEVRGFKPETRVYTASRITEESLLQYFLESPSADTKWHSGWATSRERSKVRAAWVDARSYGNPTR